MNNQYPSVIKKNQYLELRFMDSQELRIVYIYDVFLFSRHLLFVQRSFSYLKQKFSNRIRKKKGGRLDFDLSV
jgi:hypothetical protein